VIQVRDIWCLLYTNFTLIDCFFFFLGGAACIGEMYRDATELLLLYGIYAQHEADAIATVKTRDKQLLTFLNESAKLKSTLPPSNRLRRDDAAARFVNH
jgi:hypothetical protein